MDTMVLLLFVNAVKGRTLSPSDLVRRSYDLIFRGGTRAEFEATFTPDFVFVDSQWDMRIVGIDAYFDRFQVAKLPVEVTTDVFICRSYIGDHAVGAVPWTWRADGRAARAFGLRDDTEAFTVQGVGLFEFRDGMLSRHEDIYDSAPLLRHWGVEIPRRTA